MLEYWCKVSAMRAPGGVEIHQHDFIFVDSLLESLCSELYGVPRIPIVIFIRSLQFQLAPHTYKYISSNYIFADIYKILKPYLIDMFELFGMCSTALPCSIQRKFMHGSVLDVLSLLADNVA